MENNLKANRVITIYSNNNKNKINKNLKNHSKIKCQVLKKKSKLFTKSMLGMQKKYVKEAKV